MNDKRMKVAVIGAGIMGTGIAQACAEGGHETCLYARRRVSLTAARERIDRNQDLLVTHGLLSESGREAARRRLRLCADLDEAVVEAEFVVESIPEDLACKRDLFARLEGLSGVETILASNTSSIPITRIAEGLAHPERVVGFHWLNPAHLMRPVEVVRGEHTADAVMDATCRLVEALERYPVRVERDVPGFLWNRLQMALIREAVHLIETGIARPEDIDLAVQWGLGFRWATLGPMRVMDLAGLGTLGAVTGQIYPHLCNERSVQASIRDKLARGQSGAGAGRGFYVYAGGEAETLMQRRDARLIALLQTLQPETP